jgi:hypothetical protein
VIVVRFYWTDRDGHIHFPPDEVECLDDQDAVTKATARLGLGRKGWSIEIWDRARRIAKLSAAVPPAGDNGGAERQDTAVGATAGAASWTPFHAHAPESLCAK